jgi:hypothetical protein
MDFPNAISVQNDLQFEIMGLVLRGQQAMQCSRMGKFYGTRCLEFAEDTLPTLAESIFAARR